MFARVRVPMPPYEGLLVPDVAIGTEQARRFVMVIDDQDTARPKYVTLGQVTRTACASSRMASGRMTASLSAV